MACDCDVKGDLLLWRKDIVATTRKAPFGFVFPRISWEENEKKKKNISADFLLMISRGTNRDCSFHGVFCVGLVVESRRDFSNEGGIGNVGLKVGMTG